MTRNQSIWPKPSPLIVVGFSARAAAQSAIRSGYNPVAIDICGDRDLLAICSAYRNLENSDWLEWLEEYYAGVPILMAGGMENRLDALAACQKNSSRAAPSTLQIQMLRSTEKWKSWAIESAIGWPDSIFSFQEYELQEERLYREEWLVKSTASVGGLGIQRVAELGTPINESFFQIRPHLYLQKRLLGESIGVSFLSSQFGSVVVGAALACRPSEDLAMPEFVYRGSVGPIAVEADRLKSLEIFANAAASESGILGLWQADFVVVEGAWYLLEINPRWSASMELHDSIGGLRLVELHVACAAKSMCSDRWRSFQDTQAVSIGRAEQSTVCKQVLYAQDDFVITREQSDAWWERRWKQACPIDGFEYADIPCDGTRVKKHQPILSRYSKYSD